MQNRQSGIPGTGRLCMAEVLHLYTRWWDSCRLVWRRHCRGSCPDVPACGTPHNEEASHSAEAELTRWVRRWSAGHFVRLSEGPAVALIVQKGELPAWEWRTSRWRCSPAPCRLPASLHTCTEGGAYSLINSNTNHVRAPFSRLVLIFQK